MLAWLKAVFAIALPLIILCVGLNAAVLLGYVFNWFFEFSTRAASAWGFLDVPPVMRPNLEAALVVVNCFAALYFIWLLRFPLRAARQNNLTLKQFALLPLKRRRELVQGPTVQAKPRNPFS
jgi:hypothetical protein